MLGRHAQLGNFSERRHNDIVVDSTDVYDAARRRAALAAELREREKDGWGIIDRSQYDAILVHEVRPPWWILIVQAIFALSGALTRSNVRRWLHVEVLEGGVVSRSTTGDIPKQWPKKRTWEVPDGRFTVTGNQ